MFVECLFENVMQSISISWKIAEFGVIIEDKTAFELITVIFRISGKNQ